MKGFTKCSNGHYYKEELASCPYCQGGNAATEIAGTSGVDNTQPYTQAADDGKTRPVGGFNSNSSPTDNSTVFVDEVIKEIDGKQEVITTHRSSRMLVGWLVSYSFDKMGADFRLYEGRNVIGRDADCNITVHDKMMSGKHATILFRGSKYVIKDELSSHGTFVNDKDIESEHFELHDGDLIQMGETVFKFRSAL
jgi:hypothetical protein